MLVGHVCLQEVLVAKLLVAQLAVGLNVEDLNAAARAGGGCEASLCLQHAVTAAVVSVAQGAVILTDLTIVVRVFYYWGCYLCFGAF